MVPLVGLRYNSPLYRLAQQIRQMNGATFNNRSVIGGIASNTQQNAVETNASHFSYIIADDHPSVTLAVSQVVCEVVGMIPPHLESFTGSAQLLEACASPAKIPRIVILDLVMPGALKRASLVRALTNVDPCARVLAYTAEESAFLARRVMEAGAIGYVAKTSPVLEVMNALAAIVAGARYIDQCIDLDSINSHPWSKLTDSERSVLLAFCNGAKASDIVSLTGRSYSTVTTHKYNGLAKLGLRDGNDLLPYLHVNGLLNELDAEPGSSLLQSVSRKFPNFIS